MAEDFKTKQSHLPKNQAEFNEIKQPPFFLILIFPKKLKTQTLIFLASLLLLVGVQSCQNSFEKIEEFNRNNPSSLSDDISQIRAPEGFMFESTSTFTLEITAVQPGSDITVSRIPISIWIDDDELIPFRLAYGVTNSQGKWTASVMIPSDRDSITLLVEALGYPNLHKIAVNPNAKTSYTLGGTNTNGRIIAQTEPSTTGGASSSALSARATMNYMGTYNSQGVPNYLTSEGKVWQSVMEFINLNLPEIQGGVPLNNPHFLDADNFASLHMKERGEVWISFAHEGAGFKNSLGYFTFDPNNPPTSKNQIDNHSIIFPNVSFVGSGGGLRTGNRVYLGFFEAGTSIGWFLVPNGYNSGQNKVFDKPTTRYSIDELNTFTDAANLKHMVLLPNIEEEILVIGVEDLNRPSGDQDFNDAVFVIEATPFSAIDLSNTPEVKQVNADADGDGVYDTADKYPNDPTKAFEVFTPAEGSYGTIAFEDMWPKLGDYDFNDLVADYNFTEVLNADMQVASIKVDLLIRALGSSLNHGFAVQLPIDPSLIASVSGQNLNNNTYMPVSSSGVELGLTTTVIPFFTDGFGLFQESKGMINTDPGRPTKQNRSLQLEITFTQPIAQSELGSAPYDLFLVRGLDRTREIHRAGFRPTGKADLSLFNTEEDNSDIANGYYYLDNRNFPWALNLPSKFVYPQERTKVNKVYKNFIEFAAFGGTTSGGWFRNTNENVNSSNGF